MSLLSSRKLLVVSVSTINSNGLVEALRLAIGVAASKGEHRVSVLFMGDGVVHCIKNGVNASDSCERAFANYYLAAKAHSITLYVDDNSLSVRGIASDCVRPEMTIIPREDVLQLLSQSDAHLRL